MKLEIYFCDLMLNFCCGHAAVWLQESECGLICGRAAGMRFRRGRNGGKNKQLPQTLFRQAPLNISYAATNSDKYTGSNICADTCSLASALAHPRHL